jgi:CBS domain-containing protein
MKVREIMTSDIAAANPDNTLAFVATVMRDENVGSVPIVDGDGLRGIVTDRDIVVRAIADGKDPALTKVVEVLTEEVEGVEADADVTDAADLMASRQIRRLPVVEDGQVVGMVSLGDIAIKHENGTAAYALEGISEGVKARRAETSTERAVSEARRTDSAPGRTRKAAKGRRKSSKKAA